jgi:hypothetical protein
MSERRLRGLRAFTPSKPARPSVSTSPAGELSIPQPDGPDGRGSSVITAALYEEGQRISLMTR